MFVDVFQPSHVVFLDKSNLSFDGGTFQPSGERARSRNVCRDEVQVAMFG